MKVNCVASQFRGRLADGHARRRCGRRLCAGRVVISSRRISFKNFKFGAENFQTVNDILRRNEDDGMNGSAGIYPLGRSLFGHTRTTEATNYPFIWRVWIDTSPPGGTCVKFE